MKPISKAIILSFTVHAGLLSILLMIRPSLESPPAPVYTEVIVVQQSDLPTVIERPPPIEPISPEAVQMPERTVDALSFEQVIVAHDSLPRATYADILRGDTDTLRLQAARRLALFVMPLPGYLFIPSDSVLLRYRLARYGTPQQYYAGNIAADRITSQIYKEHTGVAPLFNLGGLLNAALSSLPEQAEQKVLRITSPPTRLELNILGSLWNAGPCTQLDLYRHLDRSFMLTAEEMDRVLETMTAKGYVKREKISPQDIMTVVTPFGAKSFERNELNLKNPVYRYTDLISKREILLYLDAVLFQLNCQTEGSPPTRADSLQIQSLKERIMLLIESR